MLYYLLYERLQPYISPLRVFRYTTFRTAFASLTALFLCIALGPWLIGKLLHEKRALTIADLKDKLHLVLQADLDCKTGGGRDTWILERLVLKLCAGRA